ncbi:hypothetical protein ACFSR2_24980, partial [Emticicia soli]
TGSATATVTGGSAPFTYVWTNNPSTTATASNLTAGTYMVTVTDKNLCSATATITITQSDQLTATITPEQVKCYGGNDGSATVSVTGGNAPFTYVWTNNPSTTATASNLTAGTYMVTVKDKNLCVVTATVTITQPEKLAVTLNKVDVNCYGGNTGSATATVTGGSAPFTYVWTNNPSTTATASNLTAGTYMVTVTDKNLCSATATITITQSNQLSATITPEQVKCYGGNDGSATVSVTGGNAPFTYVWTNNPSTTATASNLTAGTYMVTVKDKNLCVVTATVTITQPEKLAVTLNKVDVNCYGGNTGSATATVTGGSAPFTYVWTNNPSTTATASNLTAGTYMVTVTDKNLCSATATITITQSNQLSATITPEQVKCYGGNDGSATVSVTGGNAPFTYVWTNNASTTATASNLTAGTYMVTVKDKNLCVVTATVTITQP